MFFTFNRYVVTLSPVKIKVESLLVGALGNGLSIVAMHC